jgi:hypothetical protein
MMLGVLRESGDFAGRTQRQEGKEYTYCPGVKGLIS